MEQHEETATAPAESSGDDPAWRLTAWLLPGGAAASALLVAAQTAAGTLGRGNGIVGAVVLVLLCLALLRDARRRSRSGRWVRLEAYEYALPLALVLAALVLLARGADLVVCIPALAMALPLGWEIAHASGVERAARLLPHALPVLNVPPEAPPAGDVEVEGIVRDVLDRLPPDIVARLQGWTVETQAAMQPQPRDEIVFGCCFYAVHVIAIYWQPHVQYHGYGEPLRQAVTYTVLHEIGHALGLDETGVRRLGWLADATPG
jgi:hypothetical protein